MGNAVTASWHIRIYEKQQLLHSGDVSGPLELGRQKNAAEELFSQQRSDPKCPIRMVIARFEEINFSRTYALLESLSDQRILLKNESTTQSIGLPDGSLLNPKMSCELDLPTELTLGRKTVRLEAVADLMQSLVETTPPPGLAAFATAAYVSMSRPTGPNTEAEAMVRWLQAAMGVLQSAINSSEFFDRAAQAVVDLVGLDSGRVLLWDKGEWRTQAVQTASYLREGGDMPPSRQVLARVRDEKRTFWQVPATEDSNASVAGLKALVAAPILDHNGAVIGALYGDRRQQRALARPITKIDAMLVELLAGGVAAGLARQAQEEAAVQARVQFEQFFTPELSRYLALHPDLLQGRYAEVTLLFADIRGFSRISERLGPARTVEWVNDVMSVLSECVLDFQGVLVDYIGDELMAMWGAPGEQADHAALACRSALAMLEQLPILNQRWQATLQEPMDLGIGINTGMARVGNTGTQRKFKYGPLGSMVNLASRVQGATKYLKTRLLITEATHERLKEDFASRRLCRVRVVNIAEPVNLFELGPTSDPTWLHRQQLYENALSVFETGNFRNAVRSLGMLANEYPEDGPSMVLLSRAVAALVEERTDFDTVWDLPGK